MKDDKTLGGAVCTDGGIPTAAAAQPLADAAPAEGKKKYVPPTMKVIPLAPQRLLAASKVNYCQSFCACDFEDSSSYVSKIALKLADLGLLEMGYKGRWLMPIGGFCEALSSDPEALEKLASYLDTYWYWSAEENAWVHYSTGEALRQPGATVTWCNASYGNSSEAEIGVYVPGCDEEIRVSFFMNVYCEYKCDGYD